MDIVAKNSAAEKIQLQENAKNLPKCVVLRAKKFNESNLDDCREL